MELMPHGTVAVIFTALRNGRDAEGYARAAEAMVAMAAEQPGFVHIDSARSADGFGITVSYWADKAAARAWRDQPDHTAIREQGRAIWYDAYSLHIATVDRRYGWTRG